MFFAALGLSALAGYETVNWGERLLPDGSRLTDEDNFIYGGALTLPQPTSSGPQSPAVYATANRTLTDA